MIWSLTFQTVVISILFAFGALCWWYGRFPSIGGFKEFIDSINTKGGNILVLLAMSVGGGIATVRMFYYLVQLSVDGKLQQDNAYALMGLTFLTNQLTGAFVGAMLKTMTGDAPTTATKTTSTLLEKKESNPVAVPAETVTSEPPRMPGA